MTNQVQLKGMSSAQLIKKVLNNEPIFILDVRNESDFNDWKIEGNQVRIVNKPLLSLHSDVRYD